ncbi:MAG: ATP-grasp domain-containing protein [Desulfamplus sp.]|nr:ATP-grasp domain-containing protein [Desulfamplus sp.]
MSTHSKILVVGTTSDYIDMLRKKAPGKLLFVTELRIRKSAQEPPPPDREEVLCHITSSERVTELIQRHLLKHEMKLEGIACFDCGSMPLAARLAQNFRLKGYPSPRAIQSCRDKSITRRIWKARGIDTPDSRCITSKEEAGDFFMERRVPCVLKPLDGSGSERVFRCTTLQSCLDAYSTITSLQKSDDVIIETWIEGTEYSCDFIIDSTSLPIGRHECSTQAIPIRFTRKVHSPLPFFGTIMAYELVDFPRGNISRKTFLSLLSRAANALGITQGICMIDFIVNENGVSLLEMTPRAGGDCLPWLIEKGMNVDILKLAVDMAGKSEFHFHAPSSFSPLIGLRIHANEPGRLKRIDISRIMEDPRVRDVLIKQKTGHIITLPPLDYDSWNLGHIIFKPSKFVSCEEQCKALLSMLDVEIEQIAGFSEVSLVSDITEKYEIPEKYKMPEMSVVPESCEVSEEAEFFKVPGVILNFVEKFFHKGQKMIRNIQTEQIPCYLFEPEVIKERAMEFKKAFENNLPDTGFYYAVKSNNYPGVSQAVLEIGFGLDVSSGVELEMALDMNARDIVFSGPGKTDMELDMALSYTSRVVVLMDSVGELYRLEKRAANFGRNVRAGIRLNTDPGGVWKKFGIDMKDLNDFIGAVKKCPHINFQGIQFHTSWNMGPKRQVQFIKELGNTLSQLSMAHRDMIRFMDIGGGYWPEQGEWLLVSHGKSFTVKINKSSPIQEFATEIGKAVKKNIYSLMDCRICFEPGRWICNDAMHLLIRVVDKKYGNLVITDAGTNAVGWERFEIDYCPVLNLTRPCMEERDCLILGSLCTPHDIWGYRYWGNGIEEGDILMIPTQGAYTYSLRQHFIKDVPGVVYLKEH